MLLALAVAAAAFVATPETEALGRALAEKGFLAMLIPLQSAKEIGEMVAAHPELTSAEQTELRATAAATVASISDRAFSAIGHAYATSLSAADLQAAVAFKASGAGQRFAAAEPQAMAATVAALNGIDFKAETLKAFCAKTGKACAK